MTVAENIAYGLKIRGDSRESIDTQVEEMMNLIGLQGLPNDSLENSQADSSSE